MFSCEYYEIFKKTYFEEQLEMVASEKQKISVCKPLFHISRFYTVQLSEAKFYLVYLAKDVLKIRDRPARIFLQSC